MKYPKLKQTVLCQILLYLPVILLFFGPMLLGLALDLSGIWIIVGLVLALVYMLVNFMYILIAEAMLFSIRNYKKQRREYITTQNGTTRADVSRAVLSRLKRWGRQQSTGDGDYLLYYRNAASIQKWYSRLQYRVVVYSTAHLTAEEYRRCRHRSRHLFLKAPEGKYGWWQTKDEKSQPVCQINVLIILADTVAPECRVLPYRDHEPLVCLAECSTGKYYLDSTQEYYDLGAMPKPPQNFQSSLLWKLMYRGRLPLKSSPAMVEEAPVDNLNQSIWSFLAELRRDFKDGDDELKREAVKMLKTLPENQLRQTDCIIYYKYHDLLFVYNYQYDDAEPKVISFPFLDEKALKYDEKNDKVLHRKYSKDEERHVIAAIRSWAAANGWRMEESDPEEDA